MIVAVAKVFHNNVKHKTRQPTKSVTSKPVVPKVGGEKLWGVVKQKWAVGRVIGDPINNSISVVLLTLSDQMS